MLSCSAAFLHDLHVFWVPRNTSNDVVLEIVLQNGHAKTICLQSAVHVHRVASLDTHEAHIPCEQHDVSIADLLQTSNSQNPERHTPHSSPTSSLVLTRTSTNPLKNLVEAEGIFNVIEEIVLCILPRFTFLASAGAGVGAWAAGVGAGAWAVGAGAGAWAWAAGAGAGAWVWV